MGREGIAANGLHDSVLSRVMLAKRGQFDRGVTLPGHADCASCRIGKIDDAAGNVMPSIIDADIDRATVSQVGDANARTKR